MIPKQTSRAYLSTVLLGSTRNIALALGPSFLAATTEATQLDSAAERSWEREVVEFKLDWTVADPDQAVFLLGNLPELGEEDLPRAVQLVSRDSQRWWIQISLPVDRYYTYRYFLRSARVEDVGDPGNGVPITDELQGRTSKTLEPRPSKRLQVLTTLVDPLLHWQLDDGKFRVAPLERLGPGRSLDELRWGLRSFAVARRPVEFFLTNLDGTAREPVDEASTHVTPLDDFFLQDGELYTYVPAPAVGPMRRADSGGPFAIHSDVLGSDRNYRVMLPRGYDEHLDRRYPVLYHYDGLHVWDEPLPPYGLWDRDGLRMADLVSRGDVGELIQVAIDYVPDFCFQLNRARDCVSPEDTVEIPPCGRVRGMADLFVRFVATELKPHIDATYRTLPGRQHTFATGYSLGGVFALYSGWEFTGTFGAIGAQSGSFWIPRFPARVSTEQRPDLRVYLDTGDSGADASLTGGTFFPAMALRRSFVLDEGRVLEQDLRFVVGFGHTHTYANGGQRMRDMLTFLWPATREVARIPWP